MLGLERKGDIEAVLGLDQSGGQGSRLIGRVVIAALISLAAALLLYFWARTGNSSTVSYLTDPATRGNLVVTVSATGTVQPVNDVDVSSEQSGTIRKVHVDFNQRVKAGQVLAELDTDKLVSAVARARATVAAAKAKVEDARATLVEKRQLVDRVRPLAAKKISTEQALEAAEAAFERAQAAVASARADVAAAEADLQLSETNLAKARILSPIDGIVLVRNVEPGQTVATSLQAPVLFRLAEDLARMELQVDVDEADVGKVRVGQQAAFTVESFIDRKFPARIKEVRLAPETKEGVVTYKAILDVENADLLLRPGMTATADITVENIADALLIANAALRFQSPQLQQPQETRSWLRQILPGPPQRQAPRVVQSTRPGEGRVWVLQNRELAPVTVTLGATDGARTEIRKGELKPGDAVATGAAKPKT
jgi:HlyD family secretion protein